MITDQRAAVAPDDDADDDDVDGRQRDDSEQRVDGRVGRTGLAVARSDSVRRVVVRRSAHRPLQRRLHRLRRR